jgi:hypothetical protein
VSFSSSAAQQCTEQLCYHFLITGLSVVFLGLPVFLLSVRIYWHPKLCLSFLMNVVLPCTALHTPWLRYGNIEMPKFWVAWNVVSGQLSQFFDHFLSSAVLCRVACFSLFEETNAYCRHTLWMLHFFLDLFTLILLWKAFIRGLIQDSFVLGLAVAQTFSRRSLVAEVQVRFQANPCGICRGQSWTGIHSSQISSTFPCQYYSTITSYFTSFMYFQSYIKLASNSLFRQNNSIF